MIVPAPDADRVIAMVHEHGKQAYAMGYAVADPEKHIHIVQKGLVSQGKAFVKST
jgi:hypothetical protein